MLNTIKGDKAWGGDAIQNQQTFESAMFVLSLIKPPCLWGKNAPGLNTPVGQEVLHKLKEIGMTFNYTFSVGKINTGLHDIP